MRRTKNYRKSLLEDLKDPVEAAAYVNAALEEGDPDQLLVSLRNVAEARGGLSRLAKKAHLNRGHLYKAFSRKGNPEFRTLDGVLHGCGLRLSVVAEKRVPYRTAA
jgi:probable addiction module antidote protein